jgi:hypothetical protein
MLAAAKYIGAGLATIGLAGETSRRLFIAFYFKIS